jgi:flagellar hook protein FlgE
MGIYGALSTAVTGLSAQSYALENISGNIANSQTVGYKRVDTSFQDMIPSTGGPGSQTAGSVQASARETNDVEGDISTSQVGTNMAINGSGFFVVKQNTGSSDGNAVFSGQTYYTRQGDFGLDKNGYLVNSAGYYLEGLPIDPSTGNVSGSVPSVIQVSNALLPAQATTTIDYQLNLPEQPQDGAYQVNVPGSELLKPGDFLPSAGSTPATTTGTVSLKNDTPAKTAGTADLSGTLASAGVTAGQGISITVGGTTKSFDFYDSGAGGSAGADPNTTYLDLATATGGDLTNAINTAFGSGTASLDPTTNGLVLTAANTTDTISVADDGAATAGATATLGGLAAAGPTSSVISGLADNLTIKFGSGSAVPVNLTGVTDQAGFLAAVQTAIGANGTASIDSTTGDLTITANGTSNSISVGGSDATAVGLTTATVDPGTIPGSGPVNTISATDSDNFLTQSISGGAITVYGANGSPADVELRWAKTDSAATGGTDSWSLYYMSNSAATGSQTMWTKVPQDYNFAANGSLNPSFASTTINNMTVNGISLGNITLQHGANGVTQFGDPNGTATETTLTQNGYASGKFDSVAVDNSGHVVASYSNGQQISVAQVVTANFNGANQLKSISGDAFEETTGSGSPIISTSPDITGSALEASNTDISTEFSQLIVTQQAYAAGTKIVTTANQMLQQALNMIQ